MKMKTFILQVLLFFISLIFQKTSIAQNIFSGEPVQIVGQMNSYGTSISSNSSYRKISTTSLNPLDGRGQWVKTYNVQNSGGDFVPVSMTGGTNNGFLFISGPSTNRFANKWTFSGIDLAKKDTINSITSYSSSGGGTDMGLNMLLPGRYTFVFNDAGYTNTNAKFYIAYTAATPISISNVTQTINANRTASINITTSALPSLGENLYVRYTTASDFSSSNVSSIVQATGSGTSWSATIPTQIVGTIVKYYVFTSTASSISSMSEIDKSLVALNYNDNSGLNYSYLITKGISRFNTSAPVICGTSANYTVSIIGTDTFSSPYQWQFINSNDSTLTPTNDVTNQNLGNRTQSVQFRLWRRISRVGTSNPDTSNWVLVTMNPLPTASISGTTTICQNTGSPNITFTGASGTNPFTFTYNINGGLNTTVSTISGSSATVSAPTTSSGTFTYNLVSVQDASSTACSQSQLGSATITVNPRPSVTNSSTSTICSGTSPNISLTASVTSTFVWTLGTNTGSITGASASNGSSINQTLTNPSNTNTGSIVFNVTPTSTSGSCVGNPSAITVTVNPIPAVTNSSTATKCSGTSTNITLAASAASTYAWTLGTNTGSIAGATASNGSSINQTLTNPSNANTGSIVYNVTPTSTTGLCVGNPSAITVIVNPRPSMTSSSSQTVCSGVLSSVSLTATTSGGTNSFIWNTLGNSNLSNFAASGTTSTIGSHNISNNSSTPQTLVYSITPTFTNNSVSCAGTISNHTYTINPIPIVNSSTSQTVCSGVSSSVSLTTNTTGGTNSFVWNTNGNSNLVGFSAIGSASTIGSHTITNSSTIPQTLVYNITPTFTNNSVSCTGTISNHTYTINPIPILNSSTSQTVCSGVSSTVALSANTSGGINSFIWSSNGNSNLSGFSANGSSSQIGAQTILNGSSIPQILVYNITPVFTNNSISCNGTVANYTYTINPIPVVNSTSSQTVCSGVPSVINLTANTSGGLNSFAWVTQGNSNLSNYISNGSSDNIGSHTISSSATTPQNLIYSITPTFTYNGLSCSGNSSNYTFIINPRPIVTSNVSQTICSGTNSSINLIANTSGGTNTFNWSTAGNVKLSSYLTGANTSKIGDHAIVNSDFTNQNLIYNITPTFTNNGISCIGTNAIYTYTINPIPNVYIDDSLNFGSSLQVICSGTNFKTTKFKTDYDISNNKMRIDWLNLNSPSIQGLTLTGTNNIPSGTLTTGPNKPDSILYSITPYFTFNSVTCKGSSITTKIIVNPIPLSNNPFSKQIYCSDNLLDVNQWSFSTSNSMLGKTDFVWSTISIPNSVNVSGITKNGFNTRIPNDEIFSTFNSSNDQKVDLSYTVTPTFIYSGTSCTAPDATYTITINPKPKLPVFSNLAGLNSDTVCFNSRFINYAVDRVNPNNDVINYNYFWNLSPNNLPIIQSKQSNLSLIDFTTFSGGINVFVKNTITNNFDCNSSDSFNVYVRNNSAPRTDVQVVKRTNPSGKDQLWCMANDAQGFQWGVTNKLSFKDSILTDQITNIYNIDNNFLDIYYIWVRLSINDECAFKYYYTIPTSLNNDILNHHAGKIFVFPNPVNDEFRFNLQNNFNSNFEIFNSIGNLVYRREISPQMNNSEINVDFSSFAAGVYFLKVISKTGSSETIKFIKN